MMSFTGQLLSSQVCKFEVDQSTCIVDVLMDFTVHCGVTTMGDIVLHNLSAHSHPASCSLA